MALLKFETHAVAPDSKRWERCQKAQICRWGVEEELVTIEWHRLCTVSMFDTQQQATKFGEPIS